ncbi:MAG: hypothetical protein QHH07_10675 [Sedimentisphaerales bacterium]|jgi:F-type H+-transporting ATPase subunit b|nr:hypothetical protein [Sedimentisphaerales bacterium]
MASLGLVCLVILAEGEGANHGIFGGSFAEAFWTVVAFLVLLLVLGRFAWRPILAALKAR